MQQQFEYVGIGKEGFSTINMNQEEAFVSSYVYKKVQVNAPPQVQHNQKFVDRNFDVQNINLQELDSRNHYWARLSSLVAGDLFKESSYSHVDQKFGQQINFFKQIRLFPIDYYKTLFTNILINSQGVYRVILNIGGVFRYVYVDDQVPVSEDKLSSIWGMRLSFPWEIILLKAYAKSIGGYKYLRETEAFSFIKAVSFNNWRIKNLNDLDKATQLEFLKHKLHGDITPNYLQQSNANLGVITVASKIEQSITYQLKSNKQNINQINNTNASQYYKTEAVVCSTKHSFTIISRSKHNPKLWEYGLLPDSACYRVSNVMNIQNEEVLRVQSSAKAKWNGRFSIHDPSFQQYYSEKHHRLSLERNFLMSVDDFRQIFSSTLISPIDYQIPLTSSYSYQTVNLPQNCKHSQYFQFEIVTPGKYDLSITQPHTNMVEINQQIHSFSALKTSRKAYPKIRVLIGRRNQIQGQISTEAQTIWDCVDASFHTSSQPISTYFQNLTAGRYMMRVKFDICEKPLSYNIDIVSDEPVKLYWVDPPKLERSLFQRSCLLTLAREKGDIFYLDSQTCQEWVSYGNAYQQIGYSFIGLCSQKKSPYKLYCEINQQGLERQGYSLKYPYKGKGKNGKLIGLFSESGIAKTIVLKQKPDAESWPPFSIRFYKVQI